MSILVAGPLVAWIIGVTNNSVLQYETELKNDRLLLVVHGPADEVEKARGILSSQGVDVNVHDAAMSVAV